MDTELKPCPFCGEEAGICEANDICFHRDDDGNKIFGGWRCFCPSCAIEQVGYETREEAVSAWNNRSTEHATHRAPVDEKGGGRMTGIERLREFAAGISPFTTVCGVTTTSYDREHTEVVGKRLRAFLAAIADQIERERAEDCYKMGLNHGTVSRVIADMERHTLGHEGMEDSPVDRWARELREALGGDGLDHAADASVSAYDLLPQEEREAVAWVREHGGIESVKAQRRESMPRAAYERKKAGFLGHIAECETALGRRREIISELNHRVCDLTRENAKLRKRAMPEGMGWPRYESGEPVRIGYVVDDVEVRSVVFRDGGILLSDCTSVPGWGTWRSYKEPIRRSAPKVLASDGEPLEVGQTVWWLNNPSCNLTVDRVDSSECVSVTDHFGDETQGLSGIPARELTHRAPVLAADGRPLHEGEMVYHIESGDEFTVMGVDAESGDARVRWGYDFEDKSGSIAAKLLTHERPDSWERLEEDAEKDPCGYFGFDGEETCGKCPASGKNCEQTMALDIVRRAKKLAGVSE